MRLRVLQVNKLYHPWIGGVERVVQDIAEGLKDSFEVRVLACQPRGLGESGTVSGIPVVRAGSLGIYIGMPVSVSLPFLFRRMARETDIIHVHLPFPLAVWAYPWTRSSARLVVSWHSALVRYPVLDVMTRRQTWKLLERADRVVVASPALIESSPYLRDFHSKCALVPFGIDPQLYTVTPQREESARILREKYSGRPIVLFVGRFAYYKGLDVLIVAMGHVNSRAVLVLVGDGPLRPKIERLTRLQGLEDRVIFAGSLPQEELVAYYRAASILVLPSLRESEAFGLVQLEAMACGLPIINTRLPTGVPWVSPHGKTGLTVKPGSSKELGDALELLLHNEQLRREMGEQGQARFRELFTKERMVKHIIEVYKELFT